MLSQVINFGFSSYVEDIVIAFVLYQPHYTISLLKFCVILVGVKMQTIALSIVYLQFNCHGHSHIFHSVL